MQPILAAPDLVYGVVVSLEPRVVPATGVIITDVTVLESEPGGGTRLTGFAMDGGEVGNVGMWSENFADLSVGDSVVARVTEQDGEATVATAPMVDGGSSESASGFSSLANGLAAGYGWDGPHWAGSSIPVSYYVNPSGLPADAVPAIEAAALTWEDDPGSYMDFTYRGTTGTLSTAGMDGVNVIGAGSRDSAGTVAMCDIWYMPGSDHIMEFDITYNTGAHSFATNGSASAYDIQGIGTHELGHTLELLDLYDTADSDQVMYGLAAMGDTSKRTLASGDIAGVRAIYPTAANAAPVAVADSRTTPQNTMLSVNAPGVLSNDTDADGDLLTASLVTNVAHGTLSLNLNGSFTYTPAASYSGPDSFTYRAYDGTAYSNTAAVSIAVTAVNHVPVAVDDAAAVAEGGVLSVPVPGVVSNDSDADGDTLSASLVDDVAHGTLTLHPDGSYTYTPTPGLSGTDTFTYCVFDGVAHSAPARVTITITPPDTTAPHTTSDRVAYYANTATINLTAIGNAGGSGVAGTFYTLNSGSDVPSSTVRVSGAGTYTLVFWSVDTIGNVEAPHTVSFTVIAKPASSGTPSTPSSIATLKHGRALAISGYIIKHTAGTSPVTLQFYRYEHGHWRLRKSATAKASNILTFSKYSRAISVPYSGKWRVRAGHKVGSHYHYSGYRAFTAI
jgi:VCBS repeat-containing protein